MNRVARHVKSITALLVLGLITGAMSVVPSALDGPSPVANPAFPEIILEVTDTTVSPYDSVYYLSVFLTNTLAEVSGVNVEISAGEANLVEVIDTTRIDTSITCDTSGVCDTAIDTNSVSSVDMVGSALNGWEYLEARAISPQQFRFTGISDLPGGTNVPPLPVASSEPYLLFRIVLQRVASLEVLDTLQDRSVDWSVGLADFSDPDGDLIGLQESTFCVNPPVCDTIDTTRYYDPTVNILLSGTLTIGPMCVIGDVNNTGDINAADIISLVNYVYRAGPIPACNGVAGDVDCSGAVNSADIIHLVNHVFRGFALPCG